MSLKSISAILALTASTNASATWDYKQNGADWVSDEYPNCGTTNQSPINLVSVDADDFSYDIYDAEEDNLTKDYSNQFNVQNNNNGHTTQVNLESTTTNKYSSQLADKVFGTGTSWQGMQFHLHAGSEHTIDGVRHDLEMHTVHYPDIAPYDGTGLFANDFMASAVGLVFSVDKYTSDLTFAEQQVIDNFFNSLKWDDTASPIVDMVTYGSLMEMVDSNNRWVYKGSVTTPTCATFVYWNVLSTIYPVSQKHLDLFKAQLNAGADSSVYTEKGLAEYGNWREIQTVDKHDVFYVQQKEEVDPQVRSLIVWVAVLAVIAFIAVVACAIFGVKLSKAGSVAQVSTTSQVEMKQ